MLRRLLSSAYNKAGSPPPKPAVKPSYETLDRRLREMGTDILTQGPYTVKRWCDGSVCESWRLDSQPSAKAVNSSTKEPNTSRPFLEILGLEPGKHYNKARAAVRKHTPQGTTTWLLSDTMQTLLSDLRKQ